MTDEEIIELELKALRDAIEKIDNRNKKITHKQVKKYKYCPYCGKKIKQKI